MLVVDAAAVVVVKVGRGKPFRMPRPLLLLLDVLVTVGRPKVSRRHWRNLRAERWRSQAVVLGSKIRRTKWRRLLGDRDSV